MSAPLTGFVELVKQALEHLYDPTYLREHALVSTLFPVGVPVGVSRAQALHQAIVEAVAALRPGPSFPDRARQHRAHRILELRYVDALPFREVMAEMGLSQTQYYRDHRHAVDCLAGLLWENAEARSPAERSSERDGAGQSTFAELEAATHKENALLDLNEVVRDVAEMLRHVAQAGGTTLVEALPSTPTPLYGERTAVRQLVISLVSYVLAGARGGRVTLDVRGDASLVRVGAAYQGPLAPELLRSAEEKQRLDVIEQLLQISQGTLAVEPRSWGLEVSVTLPLRHRRLLVVDDNPDMTQFIRQLVTGQGYSVLSSANVPDGLHLARTWRPDVILLDIMMPKQDGWDALQLLKHDPATEHIPVVVCTFLGEAQLALSLGAAELLRKPLTRPALLAALNRQTAPSPLPAAAGRGESVPSEARR